MDRATRHTSLEQINHKDVLSAIVLVTLHEMLAVQQEIKSVRSVVRVDILQSVVGRGNLPKPPPSDKRGSYQARNRT